MRQGNNITPKEYPYATKNIAHIFGRELNSKVVSKICLQIYNLS